MRPTDSARDTACRGLAQRYRQLGGSSTLAHPVLVGSRSPTATSVTQFEGASQRDGLEIRAATVLPARREPLSIRTTDGLNLVGELALPEDRDPVATMVCVHPLPTHGGMMDSHILRKSANRLPALAGMAVLRFNTRGTSSAAGTSEGTFDASTSEGLDLMAAVDLAMDRQLPRIWLVGWSFGTDVVLRHGLNTEAVGAILLSPPLRFATTPDLEAWAADGRPLTALVPEFDDYLRPPEAATRFSVVPQAEVVAVPGAKHLWVGEPSVRRVLDSVVARVIGPHAAPLPTTWQGQSSTDSDR